MVQMSRRKFAVGWQFFTLQWSWKAFDLDDLNRLICFVLTSSQSIYQNNLSQVKSIAFHNTQILHDFVRAFYFNFAKLIKDLKKVL